MPSLHTHGRAQVGGLVLLAHSVSVVLSGSVSFVSMRASLIAWERYGLASGILGPVILRHNYERKTQSIKSQIKVGALCGLGFGTDDRSIALLCLSCSGMLVCVLQSGQGQAVLHRGAVRSVSVL